MADKIWPPIEVLIPRTCEYVAVDGKRDFSDEVILDCLGGPNEIIGVQTSGIEKQESQSQRTCDDGNRGQRDTEIGRSFSYAVVCISV